MQPTFFFFKMHSLLDPPKQLKTPAARNIIMCGVLYEQAGGTEEDDDSATEGNY